MKLKDKSILLVSPEGWDHIFVSKHHYSIHLADLGNKVYFLGPPIDKVSVEETNYPNVYKVSYRGFPKGLRYFPSFFQKLFIKKTFAELESLCDTKFHIIWSFDNSVFFDFSALPSNVLKISHIVDLNQDFQLEKSASTATVCLCTTELIKEKLKVYNPHVYKINHGLNTREVVEKIKLPGTNSVKALYAGNLSILDLDWVLVWNLVKKFPGIDFVFLGPNQDVIPEDANQAKAKKESLTTLNVYTLGKIESERLPVFYDSADILFVAYQEKAHKDTANPHKVMEYLGSGKVIVGTYTAEFLELSKENLIVMSKSNEELCNLFDEVVKNLSIYNSHTLMDKRRDFARSNSYEKQIERIEMIINTL